MRISIDIFVHFPDAKGEDAKLDKIINLLTNIQRKEVIIMATLDEALEKVTEETTVVASLSTLTYQIKAMLDQAIAGELSPAAQAKVDAIFKGIQDNMGVAAKAITDNTPAAA